MMKVQGQHNLFKTKNGVVVNNDMKAYEAAKKKKAEKQRLDILEQKVDRLTEMLERFLEK